MSYDDGIVIPRARSQSATAKFGQLRVELRCAIGRGDERQFEGKQGSITDDSQIVARERGVGEFTEIHPRVREAGHGHAAARHDLAPLHTPMTDAPVALDAPMARRAQHVQRGAFDIGLWERQAVQHQSREMGEGEGPRHGQRKAGRHLGQRDQWLSTAHRSSEPRP